MRFFLPARPFTDQRVQVHCKSLVGPPRTNNELLVLRFRNLLRAAETVMGIRNQNHGYLRYYKARKNESIRLIFRSEANVLRPKFIMRA